MWNSFPPFPYFLYSFILWRSSNIISFLFRSRLYSEDFFLYLHYQMLCLTSFLITVALFVQGPYVLCYFSSYSLSVKTVFAKRKNEEFFLHQSSLAWWSFFRATVELLSALSYHLAIADSKQKVFLGLVLLFLFFNLKFLHVCSSHFHESWK